MRAPATVLVALWALASCATTSGGTRVLAGGVRIPVAPLLEALPPGASAEWVEPDSMLDKVTPADVARGRTGAMLGKRAEIDMVLRAHGWTEAPAGTGDFLMTLVHIDRREFPGRAAAGGGQWVAFVIRRRADGAQRALVRPLYAAEVVDVSFAEEILRLLLQPSPAS